MSQFVDLFQPLPAHVVNSSLPKLQYYFVIISIQWHHTDEIQEGSDGVVVYGLVTRYGPQSVASASGAAVEFGNFWTRNSNEESIEMRPYLLAVTHLFTALRKLFIEFGNFWTRNSNEESIKLRCVHICWLLHTYLQCYVNYLLWHCRTLWSRSTFCI